MKEMSMFNSKYRVMDLNITPDRKEIPLLNTILSILLGINTTNIMVTTASLNKTAETRASALPFQ
jgi:hypothetical protein